MKYKKELNMILIFFLVKTALKMSIKDLFLSFEYVISHTEYYIFPVDERLFLTS
jgi:hypothetical protein